MVRWILNVLAFSAVMFGVTACGGRDASSINGLSADDAAQLNSERSTSWDSEDPPIRAQTHIAAGQLAESQGDYSSAITQYKKAIALDSQSSLAVYRMGIVYSQMRAYPDAINAWTTYSRMTGGAPEASSCCRHSRMMYPFSQFVWLTRVSQRPTKGCDAWSKSVSAPVDDSMCPKFPVVFRSQEIVRRERVDVSSQHCIHHGRLRGCCGTPVCDETCCGRRYNRTGDKRSVSQLAAPPDRCEVLGIVEWSGRWPIAAPNRVTPAAGSAMIFENVQRGSRWFPRGIKRP